MSLLSQNQQKTTKNHQNVLAKFLKDQFIGMNIKQRVRKKIQQITIYIFSNQNLWHLLDYLF